MLTIVIFLSSSSETVNNDIYPGGDWSLERRRADPKLKSGPTSKLETRKTRKATKMFLAYEAEKNTLGLYHRSHRGGPGGPNTW